MRILVLFFIVSSLLMSISCAKKEEKVKEIPKLTITSFGEVNLGGIVIGKYKDTSFEIDNKTQNDIPFSLSDVLPFRITSKSQNCLNNNIGSGKKCVITVRFEPKERGEFFYSVSVGDQKIDFSGFGLDGGVVVSDVSNWNIGTIVAGERKKIMVTIKNLGDLPIQSPSFSHPSSISIVFNECNRPFLSSKSSCRVQFESNLTKAGYNSGVINMKSVDGGDLSLNFSAHVYSGTPSSQISFKNAPITIKSSGEEYEFESNPITDQYNNVVKEGTIVNLVNSGNILVIGGNSLKTDVNGKIYFKIRTSGLKGIGEITLSSGNSFGYISFIIVAGDAFGKISVANYLSLILANGKAQSVIDTDIIRDKYGNIVEDGFPISFIVEESDATFSGAKTYSTKTMGGVASAVVVAGTIAGNIKISIKATPIYDSYGFIVGHGATGSVDIFQDAGSPDGVVPLSSGSHAIYSNSNPPQGLIIPTQTNIFIGPIKDKYSNIKKNYPINIIIENGFNISNLIPTNNFTINSDDRGEAQFVIVGNSKRGNIVIKASSGNAIGEHKVWAYEKIIVDNALSEEKIKGFFSYSKSDVLPNVNGAWGEIDSYSQISYLDSNFYGYVKNSDIPKTNFANNTFFPYFNWKCMFSAEDSLYVNFCMQPNKEYSPLIEYNKYYQMIFDSPQDSGAQNLVTNGTFDRLQGLSFWNEYPRDSQDVGRMNPGNEYSDAFNGCMSIDNSIYVDPNGDENLTKKYAVSNIITIDPKKKYVIEINPKEIIGTTDQSNLEVGIVVDDINNNGQPGYQIPEPIILSDTISYEQAAVQQRIVYIPKDDQKYIRVYISTKGTGNQAKIKVDDIAFKELSTQNIHENSVDDGVSLAYLSKIDQLIMFGGHKASEENASIVSTDQTSILTKLKDKSVGVFIDRTTSSGSNIGDKPSARSYMSMVGTGDKAYAFGGYTLGSSAYNDLYLWKGIEKKWERLRVSPDPAIADPNNSGLNQPCKRYQSGITYVPNTNELFIVGGMCKSDVVDNYWYAADDIWKIKLSDTNLMWKQVCKFCKIFSNNSFTDLSIAWGIFSDTGLDQDYNNYVLFSRNIKTVNSFWNKEKQKIIINIPEVGVVKYFDPISNRISDVDKKDGLFLLSSSFEYNYNDVIGRTFGIVRGSPELNNSKIYYWDMNRDEKQFLKFSFKMEPQSKYYAKEMMFKIYAYGKSITDRLVKKIEVDGVNIYVFNYLTGLWDLLGENSIGLKNSLEDPITISISNNLVSSYISDSGDINVMMTPKGRPGYDGADPFMGDSLDYVKIGGLNGIDYSISDMSLGGQFSCAVIGASSLKCWGNNEFGQLGLDVPTTPIGETSGEMGNNLNFVNLYNNADPAYQSVSIKSISSGTKSSCAILSNNDVKCWGDNSYGQAAIGVTSANYSKIGDSGNEMGQNLVSAKLYNKALHPDWNVLKIVSGENHHCALINVSSYGRKNAVKCWGRNNYGQLGYNLTESAIIGDSVSEMEENLPFITVYQVYDGQIRQANVYDITSGKNHVCAIVEAGASVGSGQIMQCWGKNDYGQLNYKENGVYDYRNKFSPVSSDIPISSFVKIESGADHSCLLFNDGMYDRFSCWGKNDWGQLGRGGFDENIAVPLPTDADFKFIGMNEILPKPSDSELTAQYVPKNNISEFRSIYKKMTQFDRSKEQRLEISHNIYQDLGTADFNIEFEFIPSITENKLPIISKIGKSISEKVTKTGGWILMIESSRLKFFVNGIGVVSESQIIDSEYQKIRVVRKYDTVLKKNTVLFYRDLGNGWLDITKPTLSSGENSPDLTNVDVSSGTDAPFSIGSVYDDSDLEGIQRAMGTFNGLIGYIYLKNSKSAISFTDGIIPLDKKLADYVDVGDNEFIKDFDLGLDHTCVVVSNGAVKCFGDNRGGQLGYGVGIDSWGKYLDNMGENLPIVDLGSQNGVPLKVKKIFSGDEFNCAIFENDKSKCWGRNGFGQLGIETMDNHGRGLDLAPATNEIFIDYISLEGIF